MKNISNYESSYLTDKQFNLVYDYYTYISLNERKPIEKKNLMLEMKEKTKINFMNILPKEMRIKDAFIVFPIANFYLNFFSFVDIISLKTFYTNDLIKTIFFRTLNVETNNLSFNPKEFYMNFLKTLKSLFAFNYNPKLFLTKSSIYGLSFFSFIYKFKFNDEMKSNDWIELFVLSGICTIPFSLYLENYYHKDYIISDVFLKSGLNFRFQGFARSLLISFKNIFDNFIMMSGFFISFKYFSQSEDRINKKTLSKLENYEIFNETVESNETFSRMKNLYIKDEYVTEVDYSIALFYTVAISTIIYTPIDFMMRSVINMQKGNSFKSIFDNLIKNSPSPQDTYLTATIQNTLKNNLRINLYRFFLQYGITTYYFFNFY